MGACEDMAGARSGDNAIIRAGGGAHRKGQHAVGVCEAGCYERKRWEVREHASLAMTCVSSAKRAEDEGVPGGWRTEGGVEGGRSGGREGEREERGRETVDRGEGERSEVGHVPLDVRND